MSTRRRTVEARWLRDSATDGTADAVALGTMAMGLVIGAMNELWPSPTVHARYGHLVTTASAAQPQAEPAVIAPVEAVQPMPPEIPSVPHGADIASAESRVAFGDGDAQGAAADESLGQTWPRLLEDQTWAAGEQPARQSATPTFDTVLGHSAAGDVPDVLSAVASIGEPVAIVSLQPVVDTLGSLFEQTQLLPLSVESLSSPLQLVPDVSAATSGLLSDVLGGLAPADDASTTASTGIDLLSEVLGGPPPDPVASLASDLPATILGAATESITASLIADAPLPVLDTALSETLNVDAVPMPSPVDIPVFDMPPLQLGFLGQSYVDVADQFDNGPHTLNSPLHGFI
jgi:hypothetical protein